MHGCSQCYSNTLAWCDLHPAKMTAEIRYLDLKIFPIRYYGFLFFRRSRSRHSKLQRLQGNVQLDESSKFRRSQTRNPDSDRGVPSPNLFPRGRHRPFPGRSFGNAFDGRSYRTDFRLHHRRTIPKIEALRQILVRNG